ncbi:anti-sigma factor [Glacieibacterium frigidum]|uniref:Anti-sigma factor n=1 Tax=Glacieibacterium frigidum TaxID=2593303 RepID=A0A552UFC8_9SPHN|nr:anti-sigma factor [Glacieibacterium frigidum]TRW16928.1 anti-sigma factor [Glacieibacterium frigidum]
MSAGSDLDGDDGLAIDTALGALSRDALRAAEARMASDPVFRASVEEWQRLLAPLDEATAPVSPSPEVWSRIMSVIEPAPRVAAKPSIWSSLNLWRGLAGASTAVAAVTAILLIARPDTPAAPQLLVANLASEGGVSLITATYDASREAIILTPAGKTDDAGRTPELWVIEGDNPPRSLGTIDLASPESHAIPAERLKGLKPGSTLAISLEPKGGSKTGAPTGPVVATGKLTGI